MANFEQSIDVHVPLRVAYNQWTQFEMFPHFMEGIEEVQQLTDTRVLWRAEIAGNDQEWYAEITEQTPDHRIAWKSTSGAEHAGVVMFHQLDDQTTCIMLQIDYDPEGILENVGAALGVVEHRMKGDLERFKEFIESRGQATGVWRGTVDQNG